MAKPIWKEVDSQLVISDTGKAVSTKHSKALTTHKNGKVTVKVKNHIKFLADLIWEEFRGVIPVSSMVSHIDGDYANNAITNLELIDSAINKPSPGKYHVRGTFDQQGILRDMGTDMRSSEIAAKWGCTYQHVWKMRKNATKTNEVA